jgi:chloramphenicol 3-O phosphotransferase
VITSDRIFRQFTEAARPYALFTVHVTCSLDELKRRERVRGDRHPGTAEASFTYLYPKDGYDLTVDTTERTTAECADVIRKAVFSPDE